MVPGVAPANTVTNPTFTCPCGCGASVDGRFAARAARAARVRDLAEALKGHAGRKEADDLLYAAGRFWQPFIRWAHGLDPAGKIGVPSATYVQVWIDRAERVINPDQPLDAGEDVHSVGDAGPSKAAFVRRFAKPAAIGAAALIVVTVAAGAMFGTEPPPAPRAAASVTDPADLAEPTMIDGALVTTTTSAPEDDSELGEDTDPAGDPATPATDPPSDPNPDVDPYEGLNGAQRLARIAIDTAAAHRGDLRELIASAEGCATRLECASGLEGQVTVLTVEGSPAGTVGFMAYDATQAAAVAVDKNGTHWCVAYKRNGDSVKITFGSGETVNASLLACDQPTW